MKSLKEKLLIHKANSIAILNLPEELNEFENIEFDTELYWEDYDLVLAFLKSKANADQLVPEIVKHINEKSILWFAYPKKTSNIETDIDRDHGWEITEKFDLMPVTSISIDDTWSVLRFKYKDQIKEITRKF